MAENFWRGNPSRIKPVVEDAMAAASIDLGMEAPFPQLLCRPDSATGKSICEAVVRMPGGVSTIQGNAGFTTHLKDLGLKPLRGHEDETGMVAVNFQAGKKVQVQLKLVPPLAAAPDSIQTPQSGSNVPVRCRLALIINDFGKPGKQARSRRFGELPGRFTAGIHPELENLESWKQTAADMGMELVLNLPMEPKNFPSTNPGNNPILVDHPGHTIRKLFSKAYDKVKPVSVVKTYMGGLAVEDRDVMRPVLEEASERGLIFLDTTLEEYSVVRELGREVSVRVESIWKAGMIDERGGESTVAIRFDSFVNISRSKGYGIGVIHAKEATLKVLAQTLPALAEEGVVVVPLSEVLRQLRQDPYPQRNSR